MVLSYRLERRPTADVVLLLSGDLAGERWTDRLREHVHEHYLDDGVRGIALDLAEVDSIDLQGASTLLALRAEGVVHGKPVWIEGASDRTRTLLRETGALAYLEEAAPR